MKAQWLRLCFVLAALPALMAGAQEFVPKAGPDVKFTFTTTTALSGTSPGGFGIVIPFGTIVTLTAKVTFQIGPVTGGTVNFCDATATYCTDAHLLGTVHLNSAGTATVQFYPGIGTHEYKAVFNGFGDLQGSASAANEIFVVGEYPTTTSLALAGDAENYTLTATVSSAGGPAPPTGNLVFLDTSNQNSTIAEVPLVTQPPVLGWVNSESLGTANSPGGLVAADFNKDGHSDLAFVTAEGNTVSFLLGEGNGTFSQPETFNPVFSDPAALAVIDFNGDGYPDMAMANYSSAQLTIFEGGGNGTFSPLSQHPQTGYSPVAIVSADFDGDGFADLAVLNTCGNDDCITVGSVTILHGNGDGTFTRNPASPATGEAPESMVVADFNGDGIPDLAVANSTTGSGSTFTSNNSVTILLGKGDGTFTAMPVIPNTGQGFPKVTGFPSLAVADFNRDGKADLAVTNQLGNSLTILMGVGNGTFTLAASPPTGNLPGAVAAGDFNGDGIADLAVTNVNDDTITILLGKGDGTFIPQPATPATDDQPNSLAVGDFNGDGVSDLAVTTNNGETMAVLLTQVTQSSIASASGLSFPPDTGTHKLEARYSGDIEDGPSISRAVPLTAEVTPKLAWTTPSAIVYGTGLSASQLNATASAPGTFIYTPALGTMLTAGAHTLTASFVPSDPASFAGATTSVTLTVSKAVLFVTAKSAVQVYGSATPAFSAALTGFVAGDTPAIATTGSASLSTTATASSPAGSYLITVTVGTLAAPNYLFRFIPNTLTIAKAVLTITVNSVSKVYAAPLPAFAATIVGFVNGDTAAAISGSPALATVATAGYNVGAYPITAATGTLAASNYSFKFVPGTLTIATAVLTVTGVSKSKVYGAAMPNLGVLITGFLNGDLQVHAVTGAATFSTTATASSAVGVYPVTAGLGTLAARNYTFTFVPGTLNVTPAPLTVAAVNVSVAFNQSIPALTFTFTGLVNGDTSASFSGAPTETTSAAKGSAAGSYPITIAQGSLANSNYAFTFKSGTLTITPATAARVSLPPRVNKSSD